MNVTAERPLRVLVVAANASVKWGGEAILPVHVFRGLRAAGHEAWLCVGRETKPELDEVLGEDAARVKYVDDTGMHAVFRRIEARAPRWMGTHPLYYPQVLSTQLRQRRLVQRLIGELKIDIVHQPTPVSPRSPSFLFGLAAPLVLGPMNGGMTYPPGFSFFEGGLSRTLRNAFRRLASLVNWVVPGKLRAQCLLVANRRTQAALPAGVQGEVILMPENGIVPELWSAPAVGAATAPRSARRFELVFIGRLERWKGVDWLIAAMSRVSARTACRLTVVGDFRDERVRLEALARGLGLTEEQVRFTGFLPQARCAEILHASDALVLPSVFECGGAVVLEAMAAGKAVIAVEWGGPSDYLDSSCGVLIPPRTPEDLTVDLERAIASLASDPARCSRMGEAGRAKVLHEYAWPRKIEQFLALYRTLIARPTGTAGAGPRALDDAA